MSITSVHPAEVGRGANRYLNSLCRSFLAAVLIGTTALAGAQEADEKEADVAQTEVEEAEVTHQTELEDAPEGGREMVVSAQSPQFGRVTLHMSL